MFLYNNFAISIVSLCTMHPASYPILSSAIKSYVEKNCLFISKIFREPPQQPSAVSL